VPLQPLHGSQQIWPFSAGEDPSIGCGLWSGSLVSWSAESQTAPLTNSAQNLVFPLIRSGVLGHQSQACGTNVKRVEDHFDFRARSENATFLLQKLNNRLGFQKKMWRFSIFG
jgi:hypothetical protein